MVGHARGHGRHMECTLYIPWAKYVPWAKPWCNPWVMVWCKTWTKPWATPWSVPRPMCSCVFDGLNSGRHTGVDHCVSHGSWCVQWAKPWIHFPMVAVDGIYNVMCHGITQQLLWFIDYLPNCIVIIVFLGLGGAISPLWPDIPIAASCKLLRISPTLLLSLSPYLIPAGFLTITVYSRLGLPSPRMVPYHSTPPLL